MITQDPWKGSFRVTDNSTPFNKKDVETLWPSKAFRQLQTIRRIGKLKQLTRRGIWKGIIEHKVYWPEAEACCGASKKSGLRVSIPVARLRIKYLLAWEHIRKHYTADTIHSIGYSEHKADDSDLHKASPCPRITITCKYCAVTGMVMLFEYQYTGQ